MPLHTKHNTKYEWAFVCYRSSYLYLFNTYKDLHMELALTALGLMPNLAGKHVK